VSVSQNATQASAAVAPPCPSPGATLKQYGQHCFLRSTTHCHAATIFFSPLAPQCCIYTTGINLPGQAGPQEVACMIRSGTIRTTCWCMLTRPDPLITHSLSRCWSVASLAGQHTHWSHSQTCWQRQVLCTTGTAGWVPTAASHMLVRTAIIDMCCTCTAGQPAHAGPHNTLPLSHLQPCCPRWCR
jgi:hypothetical protein